WDNEFLLQNYRGKSQNGQIDHDYNWYDGIRKIDLPNGDSTTNSPNNPCDFSSPTSCDDNGHGTYTMGLMTGNFENQFTGIAPGTQWISARVMKKGDGRLSTYLRGLEWCLAPTDVNGNNPRPELAPDIINNSWDCPRREGCIPENYWILDSAAVRLNQAGILTVASAGNNGRQGCQSLTTPLALFSSIFTVGAIDRNDSITDFSSRGPIDSSSDIKPDVVAPGKGITSIYPGGKFQTSSGTSSSAPITAGVAALILEANPALKGQPDLLRNILSKSALPINENSCGESTSPNPVYGYGRIDAMKAIQLAKEFHPTSSRPALPENSFSLYPNPFRNEVHLKSHVTSSARINIYDIRGQLTTSFTLAGHEEIELVLSDLQIGLHFAQIITSKGILLRKLIKI
ncbi:MAG: S8 family peptidase, partial [Saprospiraceae bacterium]|nr:S8 family peptidase [Saprospiraceae bacterium]